LKDLILRLPARCEPLSRSPATPRVSAFGVSSLQAAALSLFHPPPYPSAFAFQLQGPPLELGSPSSAGRGQASLFFSRVSWRARVFVDASETSRSEDRRRVGPAAHRYLSGLGWITPRCSCACRDLHALPNGFRPGRKQARLFLFFLYSFFLLLIKYVVAKLPTEKDKSKHRNIYCK
jgi:hypothetical protein